MKIAFILGVILVIILFTIYEWPKIDKSKKADQWAYIVFTTIGFLLSILLIYFPDMPGPTNAIDFIFKPFEKYLE